MSRRLTATGERLAVDTAWAKFGLALGLTACGGILDVGANEDTQTPGLQTPNTSDRADSGRPSDSGADSGEPPDIPVDLDAGRIPTEDGSLPLTDSGPPLEADGSSPGNDELPIPRSGPILVNNDGGTDNWQGEHALLAAAAGVELAGIVINDSPAWPDLNANLENWQLLIESARASGIAGIPDPLASGGAPLVRPDSGAIDETVPNGSAGARLMVESANRLGSSDAPLVIVTGGRLTDVADAYLLDPSIAESILVVSSLGQLTVEGAEMGIPNGEMDPWANVIVAERLRYVQVSVYYDQLADVPDSRLNELPANAFGEWIAAKRLGVYNIDVAADQVGFLAATLPGFSQHATRSVLRVEQADGATRLGLIASEQGNVWLVDQIDASLATNRFWELLSTTF